MNNNQVNLCKYSVHGGCKRQAQCTDAHPFDASAAAAEYSSKKSFRICRGFIAGNCSNPECKFLHTAVILPVESASAAGLVPTMKFVRGTGPAHAAVNAAGPAVGAAGPAANAATSVPRQASYTNRRGQVRGGAPLGNRARGARPAANKTIATPLHQKLALLGENVNRLLGVYDAAVAFDKQFGGKSEDAKQTINSIEQLIASTMVAIEGLNNQSVTLGAKLGAPAPAVEIELETGEGSELGSESGPGSELSPGSDSGLESEPVPEQELGLDSGLVTVRV